MDLLDKVTTFVYVLTFKVYKSHKDIKMLYFDHAKYIQNDGKCFKVYCVKGRNQCRHKRINAV